MTPTVRNGGATSGNSSVFSLSSANNPKITIATIATTVIKGRLIAKSEIIIERSQVSGPWSQVVSPVPYLVPRVRWLVSRVPCLVSPVSRLPPSIRRHGADFDWGFLGDAACGAEENGVARLHSAADLNRLRRGIANSQLHLGFLHHAVLDAHDERTEPTLVHRGDGQHRRAADFAGDMPVGKQPADEHTVFVRKRYDDAHLTRRRIGDG